MNKEAVFHLNTEEYIYPVSRNRLVVRLRTAARDFTQCKIIYWSRTNPDQKKEEILIWKNRDELFDYFQGALTFSKVARYQKYYFMLEDNTGQIYYFTSTGITDQKPEDGYFEYLYANNNDIVQFPEWADGTVYYHIFPERFCDGDTDNNPPECQPWGTIPTRENYMGGDLQGIIDKADYLQQLGVECLYINPVFEGDFNHKYATTNYYKIDPQFGTNELFRKLVDTYHKIGIRVILDGVFNHTGVSFPPFQDLIEHGEDSDYKKWFLADRYPVSITHHDYECVGAYKWMPKLNSSLRDVRNFIIHVMEYWIKDYGIDGWRLDVADEVDKTVWQEAGLYLREKYPHIILIGETWQYGGTLIHKANLDSVMNYMFRDAVRDYFGYEKISTRDFDYRINHMLALYREEENHILYNLLDSHDTERFLYYCQGNKDKFKLAAAYQMLFIGAPAIFYGDEVGITGGNDPDCRRCMLWDKTADQDIKDWYRNLIQMRKQYPALRKGAYFTVFSDSADNILEFTRELENERIYIIIHKGNNSIDTTCLVSESEVTFTEILDRRDYVSEPLTDSEYIGNNDQLKYPAVIRLNMEPYSVKVLVRKEKSL